MKLVLALFSVLCILMTFPVTSAWPFDFFNEKTITANAIVDNTPLQDGSTCIDSDGGIYSERKGVVEQSLRSWFREKNKLQLPDECRNESVLSEKYCERRRARSVNIFCEHGCAEGACIQASPESCALALKDILTDPLIAEEKQAFTILGKVIARGKCAGTYTIHIDRERYDLNGEVISDPFLVKIPPSKSETQEIEFKIRGFATSTMPERAGGTICGTVSVMNENGVGASHPFEIGVLANNDPLIGSTECVLRKETKVMKGLAIEFLPEGERCIGEKKDTDGFVIGIFEGDALLRKSMCVQLFNGICDSFYKPGSCFACEPLLQTKSPESPAVSRDDAYVGMAEYKFISQKDSKYASTSGIDGCVAAVTPLTLPEGNAVALTHFHWNCENTEDLAKKMLEDLNVRAQGTYVPIVFIGGYRNFSEKVVNKIEERLSNDASFKGCIEIIKPQGHFLGGSSGNYPIRDLVYDLQDSELHLPYASETFDVLPPSLECLSKCRYVRASQQRQVNAKLSSDA